MQRRFEADPLFQATLCCCRSACPRPPRVLSARRRVPRRARDAGRRRDAGARLHAPRHAGARSAAAVERPLSRDGHQRGRRLQPLAGPRGHPLARGRDARQLGHVLLPPRRRRAASSGRPRTSRRCKRATAYEAIFTRGPRRVPPARQRHRHAHRDRRLARRRHRAAPRHASPTARATRARSR